MVSSAMIRIGLLKEPLNSSISQAIDKTSTPQSRSAGLCTRATACWWQSKSSCVRLV